MNKIIKYTEKIAIWFKKTGGDEFISVEYVDLRHKHMLAEKVNTSRMIELPSGLSIQCRNIEKIDYNYKQTGIDEYLAGLNNEQRSKIEGVNFNLQKLRNTLDNQIKTQEQAMRILVKNKLI